MAHRSETDAAIHAQLDRLEDEVRQLRVALVDLLRDLRRHRGHGRTRP